MSRYNEVYGKCFRRGKVRNRCEYRTYKGEGGRAGIMGKTEIFRKGGKEDVIYMLSKVFNLSEG